MSSIRQTRTIFIATPLINDSGISNNVKGYEDIIRYDYVDVVPAYGETDIAMYGNNINDVLKFHKKQIMGLDSNVRYGIYLDEEPTIDIESGLYQEPPYIAVQVLQYNGSTVINGEKQVY